MHNIVLTELAPGRFLLKGDLTVNNINKKKAQLLDLKQAGPSNTLDLKQLGKIDSSGLALLIEWVQISRTHAKEIQFDNIPEQLAALAELSYLSEIDLFTTKETLHTYG